MVGTRRPEAHARSDGSVHPSFAAMSRTEREDAASQSLSIIEPVVGPTTLGVTSLEET